MRALVHYILFTTPRGVHVVQPHCCVPHVQSLLRCVQMLSDPVLLQPGDVILTGTPPGVGCFRKPVPLWLVPGDEVTVEIEKIGAITNKVIADTFVEAK